MTIAGRLKMETAAAHDRLDAGLDLLHGGERYAAALARFWGFYAGAEPQLDRWHTAAGLTDWPQRRKLPALRADLLALGMTPAAIDALPVRRFGGAPEVGAGFGWLYVLEGATLGGAVIARHVRKRGTVPAGALLVPHALRVTDRRALARVPRCAGGVGRRRPAPRRRGGGRRGGDVRRLRGLVPAMSGAYLRAGEPVDLDNCHREPIHIPGSIQPHGCLLALHPDTLEALVASANCADFVGAGPDTVVGAPLASLLGDDAAAQIGAAAGGPQHGTTLLTAGGFDVLVHTSGGTLLAELLRVQGGARPLTFTDTYRRAQSALSELNEGLDYERLLEVAVRRVRELTGFDRVMVYRYDAD